MTLLKLLCIIVLSFTFVVGFQLCEKGWLDHGSSCFSFVTGSFTWKAAEDICRAHNSNLASIDTIDKQIFVYRLSMMLNGMTNITGRTDFYWIGARDFFSEGAWRWIKDGKSLDSGFQNWADGYPLKSNSSNCVYYSVYAKVWYDGVCDNNHIAALCEKPINITNVNSVYGFGK